MIGLESANHGSVNLTSLLHQIFSVHNSLQVMDRRNNQVSMRGRIIGMREAGLSIRDIAIRLGISATTVAKWIRRWEETGNLTNLGKYYIIPYLIQNWFS